MTFRSKTVMTIVLLTAIALGGAFAAVSGAFNRLQRTQLDTSLSSIALQEAREAPEHRFSFSERAGPAANDVGPLTKYGIIFDENGRVLSATPPFDARPFSLHSLRHPLDQAFDLRFGEGHYRGVLVRIPNHPGKVLFLATSRDDLDGDEVFLYRAMLVAFMVAVGWVGLVAYWMGGRLTVAHREIARVVGRVTAGDLTARVNVPPSDPEVDRLGREINEMIGRLDDLLKSQQRFIAHAAHELRTPLAALSGELQQARRKQRDAASYESTIDTALAATRDLTALAEDLLTLARVRAAERDATAPIPLHVALTRASQLVASLGQERQVSISTRGDGAVRFVPDCRGDTVRLFRNVLENAIRHSPTGRQVTVETTLVGENVQIRVVDEGAGVAAAEREVIFEPFFRSRRHTESSDGSGLGLGIAREIARGHGGDLTLEAPGSSSGTCFLVRLPLRSEAPSLSWTA